MSKKIVSYFGNRFAGAIAKATEKKASARKRRVAVSEMETLENRILLSGVGTGLNKKLVNFIDADGDKVSVRMNGAGTFSINLGGATNNSDIANISINGDKAGNAGSLGIVVTPVGSFTKPVVTKWIYDPNFTLPNPGPGGSIELENQDLFQKIQIQYFNLTPGYTNIGSITLASAGGKVVVPTTIGSIGLNAAIVADIDLGSATVGNINLSTGMVAKVDAFMNTNGKYFPGYVWNEGLETIDLYDIKAGFINGVNIAGIAGAGNDFLGDITVATGINRITGVQSTFFGEIITTGAKATIGNITVLGFADTATISAAGDLTFNAADFSGVIDVGGHLNLGIRGGLFSGTILADGGISGLRSSTTDAIFVTNAEITGQILTAGAISDIVFTNSDVVGATFNALSIGDITIGNNTFGGGATIADSTFEAANIGVISSFSGGLGAGNSYLADNLEGIVIRNSNLDASNVVAVTGTIDLISVSNGNINDSVLAGKIVEVEIFGGNLNGVIGANEVGKVAIYDGNFFGAVWSKTGGIGSIEVSLGDIGEFSVIKSATTIGSIATEGGSIFGSIVANGAITSITANGGASDGIADQALISAASIGSILGTSLFGDGIGAADITATGAITSVIGKSFSPFGSSGINGLQLVAGSIGAITGTSDTGVGLNALDVVTTVGALGPISATGANGGITGGSFTSNTSIGQVTATATLGGSGIEGAKFVATTSIAGLTGTSFSTDGTTAGLLNVNVSAGTTLGAVAGTGSAGSGISGGLFATQSGDIVSITGKSIDSSSGGSGILNAKIESAADITGDIVGYAAGSGNGIAGTQVSAIGDIANVLGTSVFGTGIFGGTLNSVGGDIGNIVGLSTSASGTGSGIFGLVANANAGSIAQILGDSNNINGGGGILNTLVNVAEAPAGGTFEVIGVAVSGTGIGSSTVNLASGDMDVSAVTVTGTAINDSEFFADAGSVTVNILATGSGANGIIDSTFIGKSIAPITIELLSSQAGIAIDNSVFIATAGDIGAITITNNGLNGEGIDDSAFAATGKIDAISVTAGGTAIQDSTFTADSDGDGNGEIVSITATSTVDGDAIEDSLFTGSFIGDITAKVTSAGGVDAIDSSTFTATTGSIGDIFAQTLSSSTGDWGINNSTFTAKVDIGDIEARATGGSAIQLSDFTAQTGKIGDVIAVGGFEGLDSVNVNAKTSIGDVIVGVTSVDGVGAIFNSTITAQTSTIGEILVESLSTTDAAIESSTFLAGTGIELIAVLGSNDKGGTIANSVFDASTLDVWTLESAKPADYGKMGSVTVLSSGSGAGIVSSNFLGAEIGDISVTLTNAKATTAIDNSIFTAETITETVIGSGLYNDFGFIGNIDIVNQNTDGNGVGITGSTFTAGNAGSQFGTGGLAIGEITVSLPSATGAGTGAGIANSNFVTTGGTGTDTIFNAAIGKVTVLNTSFGDGIVNTTFASNSGIGDGTTAFFVTTQGDGLDTVNVIADFDGDGVGSIADIDVNVTGAGSGILDSGFDGASIGDIDVTGATIGYAGIAGSTFTSDVGDIGNINVEVGYDSDYGIYDSTFDSANDILSITTVGGDEGIYSSDFTADGDIGNISATGSSDDAIDDSTFTALGIVLGSTGDIGTVTAESAGTYAIGNSEFTAAGTIGAVDATALNGTGVYYAEFSAGTLITSITSTGPDDAYVSIEAPVVGDLTFTGLENATANIEIFGSVGAIGDITVTAAPLFGASLFTERDGLSLINILTTLGDVTVDGGWNVDAALPFVTSLGDVNVLATVVGGNSIGAATGIVTDNDININAALAGVNNVTFNIAAPFTGSITQGGVPVGPLVLGSNLVNGADFVLI